MDKDRKDKAPLSDAESAPENGAVRGPIEGRYRTAKPGPRSFGNRGNAAGPAER